MEVSWSERLTYKFFSAIIGAKILAVRGWMS